MKFKFSTTTLGRLQPETKTYHVWDTEIGGLGARIHPTGRITLFVSQWNFRKRQRALSITLGHYGQPLTLAAARKTAKTYLGDMAQGIDPRQAPKHANMTLAEFAVVFMQETKQRKKPRTLETERSLLSRHVLPRLGKLMVGDVDTSDVSRFMSQVANQSDVKTEKTKLRGKAIISGGVSVANRARNLLSAMMTHAIDSGMRETNPVLRVKPFKINKRERYLSKDEMKRLGEALRQAETDGQNIFAITAIKIILLSGARKSEILSLKWSYIDEARQLGLLPDSKTGAKPLFFSNGVMKILSEIPRLEDSPWVFPSLKTDGHMIGLHKVWNDVRTAAQIPDVRIHDLRHTFASVGAMDGQSLYIVGRALGHSNPTTTQRYAHLADNPVHSAVNAISESIEANLSAPAPGSDSH